MRKGKYYVSVTVPKQIEPLFKNKQIRRSTGTSDFALAKQRQHALADEMYRFMDAVWEAKLAEYETELKKDWKFKAEGFADSLGLNHQRFDVHRHSKFLEEETH